MRTNKTRDTTASRVMAYNPSFCRLRAFRANSSHANKEALIYPASPTGMRDQGLVMRLRVTPLWSA
ncbi:hypothetical protein D3C75_1150690 [compost metagenome]